MHLMESVFEVADRPQCISTLSCHEVLNHGQLVCIVRDAGVRVSIVNNQAPFVDTRFWDYKCPRTSF